MTATAPKKDAPATAQFNTPSAANIPQVATWQQLASKAVAGFERETADHESRKRFYSGDGVARAKAMRDELDALRSQLEKFIRT